MGARHYSPTLGRFLQPDPSALETNLYGYGANSPVSRVDPSGLWTYLGGRWMEPGRFFRTLVVAAGGAVCAAWTRGVPWGAVCAAITNLLDPTGETEKVRIDIWYQRSSTMTVAIPFKRPYKKLIQGKGGLITIYGTPKGAGRKCAEALAGQRDPYQASLYCSGRVVFLPW
jgi:hypothetical protein